MPRCSMRSSQVARLRPKRATPFTDGKCSQAGTEREAQASPSNRRKIRANGCQPFHMDKGLKRACREDMVECCAEENIESIPDR